MTYEEALQIAIEQLDDAVNYLKAMNKGFPKVEKQIEEFVSARDVLKDMQPKREWVGLTDHEILCLWGLESHPKLWGNLTYVRVFGREVEAKLKEKNV